MNLSTFRSHEALHDTFTRGLSRLLGSYDELGVFILVMAHAGFEPSLRSTLSDRLQAKFQRLTALLDEDPGRVRGGQDDRQVFRRIQAQGLAAFWPVSFRRLGPWELQLNPMRMLRPARSAARVSEELRVEFDSQGFHFGAPFLRKEILWHGHICRRSTAIFFNKFPFAPMHSILVPEPSQGRPQFLTRAYQAYLWRLAETLGERLPGIGFGYNSYGAFASVNHLHFQMHYRNDPMTIASPHWKHNGGDLAYPLRCHRFDACEQAWCFIDRLHRENCSYNLLQLPGILYCIPRRKQGTYDAPGWSEGFAWHEMAGGFIATVADSFNRLTAAELEQALMQLAPNRPSAGAGA